MSINSLDSLIANTIGIPTPIGKSTGAAGPVAGLPWTPWYTGGIIGAGAAPSGGLNGTTYTATNGLFTGAVPMPSAVAGETTRICRLALTQSGNIGAVWLVDRQWGNVPVVTTTTAQAITSPTWPARDASASTNGASVYLALEVSGTTGNVGAITNTTVSYTNSAGTSGRTATLPSFSPTAPTGAWFLLSLAAGDVGVRSVQSITLGTSYVSGQVNLIAFRWVTDLALPSANIAAAGSPTSLGLPTVWDNSVLQLVYIAMGGAIGAVAGSVSYAQG